MDRCLRIRSFVAETLGLVTLHTKLPSWMHQDVTGMADKCSSTVAFIRAE